MAGTAADHGHDTRHSGDTDPRAVATVVALGVRDTALKAAEAHAQGGRRREHEPQLAMHADHPPCLGAPDRRPGKTIDVRVERFATPGLSAGTDRHRAPATSTWPPTSGAGWNNPKDTRTTRRRSPPRGALDGDGWPIATRCCRWNTSLARLHKVDAIVVDPRRVVVPSLGWKRIRGADESELSDAWNRDQLMLERNSLRPGWRRGPGYRRPGQLQRWRRCSRFAHDRG